MSPPLRMPFAFCNACEPPPSCITHSIFQQHSTTSKHKPGTQSSHVSPSLHHD